MEGDAPSLLRTAAITAVGASGGPVELEDVRRESLDYDAFLAHRTVHRIRGTTVAAGRRQAWSMIEKVTEGPPNASPYLVDNARRELAFYASDVHRRVGPAVRTPTVLGAAADPAGRITLYLEDVRHEAARPFDVDTVLAAARDLGGMAGRWVGQVPDEPWLFRGWFERHSQPENLQQGWAVLNRADPSALLRRGWRAEAQHLLGAQDRLRRILNALPQTLCHHDAVGSNVFRSAGRTVLIDWESVGPGPVGADLASLLFSSARRGDVSAALVAANLDTAVDAYVEGVRTETDAVTVAQVRRALDAGAAVRWKLAVDVAAAVTDGQAVRRGSRPDETPEQALAELSALVDVLLDAARRALEE